MQQDSLQQSLGLVVSIDNTATSKLLRRRNLPGDGQWLEQPGRVKFDCLPMFISYENKVQACVIGGAAMGDLEVARAVRGTGWQGDSGLHGGRGAAKAALPQVL